MKSYSEILQNLERMRKIIERNPDKEYRIVFRETSS
jgi:hypothetical protein